MDKKKFTIRDIYKKVENVDLEDYVRSNGNILKDVSKQEDNNDSTYVMQLLEKIKQLENEISVKKENTNNSNKDSYTKSLEKELQIRKEKEILLEKELQYKNNKIQNLIQEQYELQEQLKKQDQDNLQEIQINNQNTRDINTPVKKSKEHKHNSKCPIHSKK